MNLIKLIILIISCFIIFGSEIYIYFFKNRFPLIYGIKEGCCQFNFSADRLPLSRINGGLEFTISLWIYIASWEYKYNQEKVILYWKGKSMKDEFILNSKSSLALGKCLELEGGVSLDLLKKKSMIGKYGGLKIYLHPKKNNLVVEYSLMDGSKEKISIKNIPLQKWVNVIALLRLRNLDIFINGALIANKFLKGVPLYGRHKLLIDPKGGFDGYISNIVYYNRALKYPEIKAIFKKGKN